MSTWSLVRLADVVSIDVGFPFKSEHFSTDINDIPLVKCENLHQQYIDWDAAKYWKRDDASRLKKYELLENDIVLAMDRPWIDAGLKWTFIRKTDPYALLVQRVARLRAYEPVDQTFLRYIIGSKPFSDYLKVIVTGVNVPHISGKQIGSFAFDLPSLPIQGKIAAILSAYDDLIENNTRRITLLEKMAEEVYREWFVRLRFPGYERVPVHHGIPDGWEMREIKDLIKRVPAGRLYSDKTALPSGKIPILDQGRSGVIGYHDEEPSVIASIENPVIVFANHTCNQRMIWFPFSAIQNVLPFVPSDNLSRNIFWLHYATVGQVNINSYKGHYPEFISKQIIVPTADNAEQFGIMSMCNFQMMISLGEANKNLKKTRDILLSRLLSGKVEIENLDIRFPVGMQGAE